MQIIGTRPNSAFRVDDQYFVSKPYQTVGVDPTTGGPVMVVEDFTDDPPIAKEGHRWVVDTDPQSPTFRQVTQKPIRQPVRQQQAVYQQQDQL